MVCIMLLMSRWRETLGAIKKQNGEMRLMKLSASQILNIILQQSPYPDFLRAVEI
ncbi:hypothetical protein JCM16418_3553 [Paenibacillus pini JCM 16418]|uniref:Uncharacterized protein n=1 Tax=Paenibacillus pini JCM 16418 TaxID=1236976 RepID=W7YP79_9BACL|nr:hypothetical protein JCM16418_3553 [Paenibacillus pini JCM 16418]